MTSAHRDPDAELVRQCQAGGSAAHSSFAKLMDRHARRVQLRAARILGDENEAEDAMQEVFVNVHRFLHRYRPDQPFSHWLSVVTLNVCRIELRKRASRNRRHDAFRNDPMKPRFSELEGDPILRGWLEEALDDLHPITRECILLRALEGLRYREIAVRLGLSEPAAKMRVLRGLRELRARYPLHIVVEKDTDAP
jgi:RNA polymerase sigma-70 factor (ECF subfamily)